MDREQIVTMLREVSTFAHEVVDYDLGLPTDKANFDKCVDIVAKHLGSTNMSESIEISGSCNLISVDEKEYNELLKLKEAAILDTIRPVHIQPGDVVSLKGGGPTMTVCEVVKRENTPDLATARCVYFPVTHTGPDEEEWHYLPEAQILEVQLVALNKEWGR